MSQIKKVLLPDIGDFKNADVIEILVSVGDVISKEDSLITLEGDKASMEIPSPYDGKISEIHIKVGDKVSKNDLILSVIPTASSEDSHIVQSASPEKSLQSQTTNIPTAEHIPAPKKTNVVQRIELGGSVHASPIVRKTARQNGIDLVSIAGTGIHGRVTMDDLRSANSSSQEPEGVALPDFSVFGDLQRVPLSRIRKLSGNHLANCWRSIPHVTQFDQFDITALEAFRQHLKHEAKHQGVRLTILAFFIKACACVLEKYPNFNASIDAKKNELILKSYFNIGFAVDTPSGLMVPVIRNVDALSIYEIALALQALSEKARDGKLSPSDMQGGCFSISSLGGIGGTYFTPIVNGPEVAILGISKAQKQPIWNEKTSAFEPRLMVPVSLSYDHRVVDGAEGARFIKALNELMADIRRVLL